VVATGRVAIERALTVGSAIVSGCAVTECINASSSVVGADRIAIERTNTVRRVVEADGVISERIFTAGRVGAAAVLRRSAQKPMAVLSLPKLRPRASQPILVLLLPRTLLASA